MGGYIAVDQILNKSQAAKFLDYSEDSLWEANEYILAKSGTEVDFKEELKIPMSVTKTLEFEKSGGFVNLKMDSEGKLDPQTLRNVRKLYSGSELKLFDAIKKYKEIS